MIKDLIFQYVIPAVVIAVLFFFIAMTSLEAMDNEFAVQDKVVEDWRGK